MYKKTTTIILSMIFVLCVLSVSAGTGNAPIAQDDTSSINKNSGKVVITPTDNDTDPDGDATTLTAITSLPSHGTALIENGRISYTPDTDYVGVDSLVYSISDGNGNSDTATLLISITGSSQTVTLNPSKTYDKHDGWGTTTIWNNVGSDGYYDPTTNAYKDTIADYAVNTLGLNRVRLEIKSGDENPVDWWAKFYNGEITRTELKDHFFQKINDNNDPAVANAAGFHFTNLDYQIEYILLPMKNKLNAKGEKLYVNICYVDFYSSKNGFNSSLNHSANPKEYAELIHEALKHIKNKYNIVPDGLEIILEPDHSVDWKPAGIGTRIGNCLVETMTRLTSDGFNITDVIAPSNTSASVSVTTFDEMIQVPGVLNYLTTYSYHKYFGYPTWQTYENIQTRATTYNLKTAMLEMFDDSDKNVFDDILGTHISSYQRWAYATPHFSTYINIDKTNANNWQFSLHDTVRAMPQIFKNVRLGAREIGAFSNHNSYRAAAYINTNGSYSLLVRNTSMSALSANGLPAGTYKVQSSGFDTNGVFQYDVDYGTFTITAGQPISDIPLTTSKGVVSIVLQMQGNAPVAQNDTYSVNKNSGKVVITPTDNDTDADGDTITLAAISSLPSHGVALVENGRISYTPDANYVGLDNLVYSISDGNGNSDTATLLISVTGSLQTVTVDTSKLYKKHDGWETSTIWNNVGSNGYYDSTINGYKDVIADYAVNTLGINRVLIDIKSGAENPTDWWGKFYNGEITRTELKDHFFQKINDNSDPDVANSNGFHFTHLDHQIENVVLPLKTKLNANGEELYIGICYVDFYSSKNGFNSSLNHSTNPNEYAELIHEAFKHIKAKYNFVPDSLQIILEPDNSVDWKPAGIGTRIGHCLVETMTRLNSNGFTLKDVIAPSNARASTAVTTFNEMILVPGVLNYLTTFAYHKYFGYPNSGVYANISLLAEQYNLKTAMLEKFDDSDKDVFDDILGAHISAYQRWAYAATDPSTYININKSDANNWQFSLHNPVRAMPQIFKNIRMGAQEIGAFSNNSSYRAAAYINTNGSYSLLVRNTSMSALSANGLPAGTYKVQSSGFDISGVFQYDVDYGTFTITAGQPISDIPLTTSKGVVSIVLQMAVSGNAPVAQNDTATLNEDSSVIVDVLNNDTDIDGDALVISSISSQPTNGSAVIQNAKVTYMPNVNFYGNDSFNYRISDGNGGSAIASVVVTVNPINDTPIANTQSVNTNKNNSIVINLTGSDVDGDTISFSNLSSPTNGTLTGSAPNVTYTPNADFTGNDSFTFQVNDGNGGFDSATISLTINDPSSITHIWMEAEDADSVTAPLQILNDVNASEGKYISNLSAGDSYGSVPANGHAVYNFNLAAGGDFKIWGRVIAPVNYQDSFWFKVDNGTWKTWSVTNSSNWNWDVIFEANQSMLHALGAGNHTLTIAYREDGTKLDKLFISSDSTVPTGLGGGVANNIPVAINDSASTNEDAQVNISVLSNDTDADNDVLTIASVTQGVNGSVVSNGNIATYTPNANFNGADSFSYTVSDGKGGTNTAVVSIIVNAINDAPVANSQSLSSSENTTLVITLSGTDIDGDSLGYNVTVNPTNGTLSGVSPNLTYTPQQDFNGSDSFTFQVNDGNGGIDLAVINITVTPVNNIPVAIAQTVNTDEDSALAITLSGSDADGDSLSYHITANPASGSLIGTAPNLTYTPQQNFNGSDSFSFQVNDGNGGLHTAVVTITVNSVNDLPIADAQSLIIDANTSSVVLLTGSDPEGDSLNYSVTTGPTNGSLSGVAPNLIYTPNTDFVGSDNFIFQVDDGNGGINTATVTVTVNTTSTETHIWIEAEAAASITAPITIIDDPSASNGKYISNLSGGDSYGSAPANGHAVYNFNLATAGDFKIWGRVIAPVNYQDSFWFKIDNGTWKLWTVTISSAWSWDVVFEANQSMVHALGAGDHTLTIAYREDGTKLDKLFIASDSTVPTGLGGSAVNVDPIAVDDAVSTNENVGLVVNVLANDNDADGNPLNITAVTQGISGSVVNNGSDLVYTPNTNFIGLDSFTYTISDGNGGTAVAVVNVTVNATPNLPPVLNSIGNIVVAEGEPFSFSISAIDPDEDSLVYSAGNLPTGASFNASTQTFSWTPSFSQSGNFDVIFIVQDSGAPILSDSETITITVGDMNRPPILTAIGNKSVNEGDVVSFNISATDPDGDSITYSAGTLPAGAVFDSASQSFVWTPGFNQNGNFSVLFQVSDNGNPSLSDSEVITITVGDVNRPPVLATIGNRAIAEDNSLNFTITATDLDGDALVFSAANLPVGATFDSQTQNFSWTPSFNQDGNHTISFVVADNGVPVLTDSETITITVGDVNRPPVAVIAFDSVEGVAPLFVSFNGNSSADPDGDSLTYSWDFGDSNTAIGVNAANTYTQIGNYSATLTVSDGSLTSQASIEIQVVEDFANMLNVTLFQPNNYRVSQLFVGSYYCVDRSYKITNMPGILMGAWGIRTANNDKYIATANHLIFDVNKSSNIYIAYDKRASQVPTWLASFTNTGLTLESEDGGASPMAIYTKVFAAGEVTLGGNQDSISLGAHSNYLVFITEANQSSKPSQVAQSMKKNRLAVDASWFNEGDSDGDGLTDAFENNNSLDANNIDSNGNGIPDEYEIESGDKSFFEIATSSQPSNNANEPASDASKGSEAQGDGSGGGCSYSFESNSKDVSWLFILFAFLFVFIRRQKGTKNKLA